MDHIECTFAQEVERSLEVLLGFATEPDDHISGQSHVGDRGADPVDKCPVLRHGVPACHALERRIMTCLHRQVDVFTDFRQHCHRLDQVIGHVIGMGGEEPDPFQTGQVVKCVQEVRQARWR